MSCAALLTFTLLVSVAICVDLQLLICFALRRRTSRQPLSVMCMNVHTHVDTKHVYTRMRTHVYIPCTIMYVAAVVCVHKHVYTCVQSMPVFSDAVLYARAVCALRVRQHMAF